MGGGWWSAVESNHGTVTMMLSNHHDPGFCADDGQSFTTAIHRNHHEVNHETNHETGHDSNPI